MRYESDNYLAHYGILGQKWGVRRFQNEDGTLTASGKERYRKSDIENEFNRTLTNNLEKVEHVRKIGIELGKKSDKLFDKYKKAFEKVKLDGPTKEYVWNSLRRDFSSGSQIDDPELFKLSVDDYLEPVYEYIFASASKSLSKESSEYERQYTEYKKQLDSIISDLNAKYGEAKLMVEDLPIGPSNPSVKNYIQSLSKISFRDPGSLESIEGQLWETPDIDDAYERIAKEFSLEEFKKRYP